MHAVFMASHAREDRRPALAYLPQHAQISSRTGAAHTERNRSELRMNIVNIVGASGGFRGLSLSF